MNPGHIDFLQNKFIPLLRNADPNTSPKWGRMNFQQMVEHFVLTLKNANGKMKVEEMKTPAEKIPAFQEFIMSEKEFRENTKSPAFPEDPLPIHFKSTEEAINKLEKEIGDFFNVYEATPGLKITNPVFGDLDYDHAVTLLYKHAQHHLKQFGLLN
jgi:hypothetical protein